MFLCVSCSSIWTKTLQYIFRVFTKIFAFLKEKTLENVRGERNRQRRLIIMVAASSPLLTTNALARMLEERPDPQAFQPVLQIAGIVLFTFLIKRYSFFLFFFERINSLCAREIEFLNKKNCVKRFNFWCFRSSFPFTYTSSLCLYHTDIRKIKNTTGEPESAENTRYRVMIRYVFCLEIISSNLGTFWISFLFLRRFVLERQRDDSSSSSSAALKIYAR